MYRSTSLTDPDRKALTAERQKEEQDERDLVARQEQADEEKRQREYDPFSDESIWTRVG